MTAQGFILFDTAMGHCGITWGERGVLGVHLPEACEGELRARVQKQFPALCEALPPLAIARARDQIAALLRGEASDLSSITLDMTGVSPFFRRVYELARTIPCGTTRTYGELAAELHAPGAARAVGQALGKNPFAIVVPCHRVLAAGGKIGGFSARGGIDTKLRILAIEASPAR